MNQKIYTISGLPGTGKTNLIDSLAEQYGDQVDFIPEFLDPYPEELKGIDLPRTAIIRAQEWVVDQHHQKAIWAVSLTPQPVVMDRGVIDALAYGWAFGEDIYFHTLIYALRKKWPETIPVIISAPLLVIKTRLLARGDVKGKDWQPFWAPFLYKLGQGYKQARSFVTETRYMNADELKRDIQNLSVIHSGGIETAR